VSNVDREISEARRMRRILAAVEGPVRYDDDGGVSTESDSLPHGPGALLTPESSGSLRAATPGVRR
jgi:hypothetical protein